MRGRLKLTLPSYAQSSYLLASDTLTERLTTRRQARQLAGSSVKTGMTCEACHNLE